jgi:hypothetical protein
MTTEKDPLRELMELARPEVAREYHDAEHQEAELAAYLEELEFVGEKLRLTWYCTSAMQAFRHIIESVWHDKLRESAKVVHVARMNDPREVFARTPSLPISRP